ncbi:pentatricopeptide repeat-containing protein [Gigaspora margarita]|uniref:Pentatricopeptide repeat-containing protein n=1 Tax=Gigaspora margarita TaxID=4874 RepID=A0A8H4A8J5_GIGMA|nr:pentatricopeptide repeat-containing protein [Gigaspora margarita]
MEKWFRLSTIVQPFIFFRISSFIKVSDVSSFSKGFFIISPEVSTFSRFRQRYRFSSLSKIVLPNNYTPIIKTQYNIINNKETITFHANLTLDYLKKAGNFDGAIQLFNSLDEFDIQKDVYTYNCIIHIYSLKQDMNKAIEYYEEMISNGIEADSVTYLILIDGFGKQKDTKKALKFYNKMITSNKQPTTKIFSSLINSCIKEDQIEQAEQIFEAMKSLKMQPDIRLYNTLIHNSIIKFDMKAANQFYEEIIRLGIEPDVYTFAMMIDGYLKVGDQESATKIYSYMINNGININSTVINILMQLYFEKKDSKMVHNIFEQHFSTSSSFYISPDIKSWTIFLKSRLRLTKDIEEAYDIYKEFLMQIDKNYELKIQVLPDCHVFNHFLTIFAHNYGNMTLSQEVYGEMIRRKILPDVVTHTILIEGYALLGQVEKANRQFQIMKSNNIKPNVFTYTSLIKAWAQVWRIDKIQQIYNEMIKSGIKPHRATYRAIASIKNSKNFDISQPKKNISNLPISRTPQHVKDTIKLNDKLEKVQDSETAYNLFENFLKNFDNTNYLDYNSKPNIYSFTIFMTSFVFHHRNMKFALKVFEEMLKRNIPASCYCYNVLIEGFVRLNEPFKAEKMFYTMINNNIKPDISSFNSLISAWIMVGRKDKVIKTYREMKKHGVNPNEFTLNNMKALGM